MKHLFALAFIFISFQTVNGQGGIEELLGRSRHSIEELKNDTLYTNVLTGDYYSLSFMLKDKSTPVTAMKFYFDKSVPNNNTTCRSITIVVKYSELDYITKKVMSDFPLFDSETGIYHTDKIGAVIDSTDPKKLIVGVRYFFYNKKGR